MEQEIWKPVVGYEGLYEVSNLGRVKSLSRQVNSGKGLIILPEKMLKGCISYKGYKQVYLSLLNSKHDKMFFVHRLVAIAFVPNYNNFPQVNHIDGNKLNNNYLNLEWCDNSYNVEHAWKTGLRKDHSNCGRKPISVNKTDIKTNQILETYDSIAEAGRKNNISADGIRYACKVGRIFEGFLWEYNKEIRNE